MVDQTKQPNLTPGTILQEHDNFMNEHSGLWDKEEGGKNQTKAWQRCETPWGLSHRVNGSEASLLRDTCIYRSTQVGALEARFGPWDNYNEEHIQNWHSCAYSSTSVAGQEKSWSIVSPA